jgi:hypothetical protein
MGRDHGDWVGADVGALPVLRRSSETASQGTIPFLERHRLPSDPGRAPPARRESLRSRAEFGGRLMVVAARVAMVDLLVRLAVVVAPPMVLVLARLGI